jgi:hypothetical protein
LDSSRLRTGELVAGIGGVALFVFLFFDWFSGGGFTGNLDGWDGLGADVTGFVVFLTSIAGVSLALLAMNGLRMNLPVPRGGFTALLGTLSVDIIIWRFFANPGDLKIGIFLGLAAALAIAIGAVMALREDGFELVVPVPGGRTRAASSATAPTQEAPAAATAPAPKSTAKKSAAAKSGARKPSARKSPAKKSAATKSAAKKTPARKSSARGGS